jgi:hypothetical protein
LELAALQIRQLQAETLPEERPHHAPTEPAPKISPAFLKGDTYGPDYEMVNLFQDHTSYPNNPGAIVGVKQ